MPEICAFLETPGASERDLVQFLSRRSKTSDNGNTTRAAETTSRLLDLFSAISLQSGCEQIFQVVVEYHQS